VGPLPDSGQRDDLDFIPLAIAPEPRGFLSSHGRWQRPLIAAAVVIAVLAAAWVWLNVLDDNGDGDDLPAAQTSANGSLIGASPDATDSIDATVSATPSAGGTSVIEASVSGTAITTPAVAPLEVEATATGSPAPTADEVPVSSTPVSRAAAQASGTTLGTVGGAVPAAQPTPTAAATVAGAPAASPAAAPSPVAGTPPTSPSSIDAAARVAMPDLPTPSPATPTVPAIVGDGTGGPIPTVEGGVPTPTPAGAD
jgi:hypothetical protein